MCLPPERTTFAQAAAWYDEHAFEFVPQANRIDTSLLLDALTQGLPPGARVLDAGCGSGRDMQALLDRGYDAHGFDPSEAMRAATHALTGRWPRALGFEGFSDPPGSWDAILAMASLLHLPQDRFGPAMGALWRALTPKGRLLAAVKEGEGSCIDTRGRPMSFLTQPRFLDLAHAHLPGGRFEIWREETGQSDGNIVAWINLLAVRG